MLQRIPDLEGLSEKQTGFRVNWICHGRKEFGAGDILIVDESLFAYRDDIVVIDCGHEAVARTYCASMGRRSGVVVEIRKPTVSRERAVIRASMKLPSSAVGIRELIDREKLRPTESWHMMSIQSPNLSEAQTQYFYSVTVAGNMGDVYLPRSLKVGSLLVESGSNLIICGDLVAFDDIVIRGALTVGGKIECDDRLYVSGDLYSGWFVHCGRLLVGGDTYSRLGIDCKEAAVIGGSMEVEIINCTDLYVAGDLSGLPSLKNASVGGSVKSQMIFARGTLTVGQDLRCEYELEAEGDVLVKGTIWSKTRLLAGEGRELRCSKRLRGVVKRGRLIETSAAESKYRMVRRKRRM